MERNDQLALLPSLRGETSLVTEAELTKHLGISRTTLWRLRVAGLPHITVGRSVRYDLERVKDWLATQGANDTGSTNTGQRGSESRHPLAAVGEQSGLLPCHWKASVALDPKHRPQVPHKPSSTVRREWWRYPQEAHLLDLAGQRYRRLLSSEVGVIQGFPRDWAAREGISELDQLRGYGDAVPPPLAEVIFRNLQAAVATPVSSAVEICAGFGGSALGSTRGMNVQHVALVEHWPAACEVLRACGAWNQDVVYEADVRHFDWERLRGTIDLLSGGPPCQPWSLAGQGRGVADDRDLLGYMPELVGVLEPKVFVLENVPGLLFGENQAYANWLINRLREPVPELSYGVVAGVLTAADFGVPQVRRRVFIIGVRDSPISDVHGIFDSIANDRTHADPSRVIPTGRLPWRTIGDAIPEWCEVAQGWRSWVHGPNRA